MRDKKYEAYHVLDEEAESIDLEQDGEQTIQLFKSAEIELEENKQKDNKFQVIDVEVINEDNGNQALTDNKTEVLGYQSVLIEEEEDDIEKIGYQDIAQKNIYQQATNNTDTTNQKVSLDANEQFNQSKTRDTSFSSYVEADKKRERSFLVKWSIRLAKFILFIMLLPVIGIIGGGSLFVAGGILLGILACIGGGIFILGTTCFIATQVNTTIIALGVSIGITAIAFGGIVLILCMMFIKKMNQVMREHKKIKSNKEVR